MTDSHTQHHQRQQQQQHEPAPLKYTSPFVHPVTAVRRVGVLVRQKARHLAVVGMVAVQSTFVAAQPDASPPLHEDPSHVAGGRNAHVFPALGEERKISVMERGRAGGRTLLHFVELVFGVYVPEVVVFVVIMTVFVGLAALLPSVFQSALEHFGAPDHKQVAVYYVTRCGLLAAGLYVALKAIGFDLISLAIMFSVSAIFVTAAFTDIIVNSVSGVLLHCIGVIRRGREVTINGYRGVVEDTGHFHVFMRSKDDPSIVIVKPNHECLTATVLIHKPLVALESGAAGMQQGLDNATLTQLAAADVSRKNV